MYSPLRVSPPHIPCGEIDFDKYRPAKKVMYFVVLARIPEASQKVVKASYHEFTHSTVTDLARFRG